VISVCGDGGFMMNSQELETAVRLGLHLVVIVLRDDAYGMIRWKQAHMQLPDYGLDFGNPDFVEYARSYGAKGWRIETTEDLQPLILDCLKDPAVHLIDVPVDYSKNDETLNTTIRELSRSVE
jgi:acetolactate synthase-1/2/3 large subunit